MDNVNHIQSFILENSEKIPNDIYLKFMSLIKDWHKIEINSVPVSPTPSVIINNISNISNVNVVNVVNNTFYSKEALKNMTKVQLIELCKNRGYSGYSNKNVGDIIDLILVLQSQKNLKTN
jgi:hypothetical protein